MAKERESRMGSRSSVTGQFVKDSYAKSHPHTTQREHIPLPGNGTADKKGDKRSK